MAIPWSLSPPWENKTVRCPTCHFNNQSSANFCSQCGARLGKAVCAICGNLTPSSGPYCADCGSKLTVISPDHPFPKDPLQCSPAKPSKDAAPFTRVPIEVERKHVTVLFSDLTGYTSMSERLDPEEVKDVLNRIFADVSRIVGKYEGYIDKFIGDAVMAIFGVPKAHEDDPFRAIMTALEIHAVVEAVSPQVEKIIGRPISMHTGINTGLIVTDEMDVKTGKHGMTGDAINLASRLTSLAGPGEVIVGPDTYYRSRGYVDFERLSPARVKGKAEPISVYKVQAIKRKPSKVYRYTGLRADLIGRDTEISHLSEAYAQLRKGNGSIVAVCGDAGTGKSRLLEEFKRTIDRTTGRWLEGHAYAYSQSMPYHLIIDILNRTLHVEEGDSSKTLRHKIESGIGDLPGCGTGVIPYIGRLYDLSYPDMRDMSPELWRTGLLKAIHAIVATLVNQSPVIFYLEDLHWADHSSIEFLRSVLTVFKNKALFLCAYRPSFTFFTGQDGFDDVLQELRLHDLPPTEAQHMIESMLQTGEVPDDLRHFIKKKVEGNPFYIEEVINTLIESEMLTCNGDVWMLTGSIDETQIPSTLHGVISARLDRLEQETKRVLQEASVIGRTFPYDILLRVTTLSGRVDRCLTNLERLNVITMRSFYPDLEYFFKHALTQEVVYNGLLKKERRIMHEKIALIMEEVFRERQSEFYEMLAYHFTRGLSVLRAVDYLMKSAEKNLQRYSLDESHKNFQDAYALLTRKQDKSEEENILLIDLLIRWAVVFNQRGDYSTLIDLLKKHEPLATVLADKDRLGMYYGWLGWSFRQREKLDDAYDYVTKALALGEEIGSRRVAGYACAWLTQICTDVGQLDEAIIFGMRAREFTDLLESDQLFFQFCMVGLGLAYFFRGEGTQAYAIGEILHAYGNRQGDIRSCAMGYNMVGLSYYSAGDFTAAAEQFESAIEISLDPMISCLSMLFLGMSYLSDKRLQDAEETFEKVIAFNDDFGLEALGTSAEALRGIVCLARGELRKGIMITKKTLQGWLINGSKYRYATVEHFLGKVYLEIVIGGRQKKLSLLIKNIGFMIKNAPFAGTLAEKHFTKARTVAREIGATGIVAQVDLGLGMLLSETGRTQRAKHYIGEAVTLFHQCGAHVYLKQAQNLLMTLEK